MLKQVFKPIRARKNPLYFSIDQLQDEDRSRNEGRLQSGIDLLKRP